MASIFAKSLSVGCCFEIAEAWKLQNKIVEACCCSSKLLHFFEKSLIVVVEILAVLTDSSRRAEPSDADDRRWHNSDDVDILG